MGIFDTFYDRHNDLSIQLKAGDPSLENFQVGDKVDLDDGLYFSREGIVVIKLNKFIGAYHYSDVKDKFGDSNPLKGKMNYVRTCSDEPAIIKNIFRQLKENNNDI